MCPAKLNVRYICSSYYHPKRWATTQQILSQTSSTKKRITGLSSRRLFVQFNWSYIWNTETFITEVTKLFKLFFFFTIIVSRSWGHLSLFLSSFTNNTTKAANARDISIFTRHILHSKNTRADWLSAAVFVVRSSATFWLRSRRLEGTHQLSFVAASWGQCGAFEPKHASLETELSLTFPRVDAAVSHMLSDSFSYSGSNMR